MTSCMRYARPFAEEGLMNLIGNVFYNSTSVSFTPSSGGQNPSFALASFKKSIADITGFLTLKRFSTGKSARKTAGKTSFI